MRSSIKRHFILLLVSAMASTWLAGCSSNSVDVNLEEFQNELAIFRVENHTDQVIRNITFEITYFSEDKTIKIDTVRYTTSDTPYAKVGESTRFAQKVPTGTEDASARVISYNN